MENESFGKSFEQGEEPVDLFEEYKRQSREQLIKGGIASLALEYCNEQSIASVSGEKLQLDDCNFWIEVAGSVGDEDAPEEPIAYIVMEFPRERDIESGIEPIQMSFGIDKEGIGYSDKKLAPEQWHIFQQCIMDYLDLRAKEDEGSSGDK